MSSAQNFSLGTLVSTEGSSAPSEVKIRLLGRGIFCSLEMEFHFHSDEPALDRIFFLDKPWNAVVTGVKINEDSIAQGGAPDGKSALPASVESKIDAVLHDGQSEVLVTHIEAGKSLRTITLSLALATDVLWHKGILNFVAKTDATTLAVDCRWNLAGLPGAGLECTGAAADSRVSNLEASRCKWEETVFVAAGDSVGLKLTLDEKKAASLCLFSPGQDGKAGCGAVVVVAPVRPQLLRKPVKIAVLVEVRNPQAGLVTRDLIDKLSSSLKSDDQVSIFFLGAEGIREILPWTDAGDVSEESLAQILEPSLMGKSPDLWKSFQDVCGQCRDATHLVLSSPGPKGKLPEDLSEGRPVFCFLTGRNAGLTGLEELALKTGGFLSEHRIDGIDPFLQRINVRLSPPLLRDFRLEGWKLAELNPAGLTQVYMDKPTLVMGTFDGALPQTVTLCGFSPSGQKLAQRVRLEKFEQFPLAPILGRRQQRRESQDPLLSIWSGEKFVLWEGERPLKTEQFFQFSESEGESQGADLGPPSIDMVASAVTIDDNMFGAPEQSAVGDDFFSGADTISQGSDFFAEAREDMEGPSFLEQEEPVAEPSQEQEEVSGETALPQISDSGVPEESDPFADPPEVEEEKKDALLSFSPPDAEGAEVTFPSEDTLERGRQREREQFGASDESLGSQKTKAWPEKPTLAVMPALPNWVKKLSEMDRPAQENWLLSCPLDELALALVDTEKNLASTFLELLGDTRRQAIELQMEMGRFLPKQERDAASKALELHS